MPPQRPSIVRVHIFFDGQNVFHAAKARFGYPFPNFDPIKLAAELMNPPGDRRLEQIHFYTEIHKHTENPFWHGFWTNKVAAIGRAGARVVTTELKYSNIQVKDGSGNVRIIRRGREKGIDVRLALDLVRLARLGEYDVAIIVSQDNDLCEAVKEVRAIRDEFKRWVFLESAFLVSPGRKNRGLENTQWREIDRATYERCIDLRDFRPKATPPCEDEIMQF